MSETNASEGAWSQVSEHVAKISEELRPLATTAHLAVLCRMAGEPPLTLPEIAVRVGLSQERLRLAMEELVAQGLVVTHRQGGMMHYSLADRRRARLLHTLRVLYLDR